MLAKSAATPGSLCHHWSHQVVSFWRWHARVGWVLRFWPQSWDVMGGITADSISFARVVFFFFFFYRLAMNASPPMKLHEINWSVRVGSWSLFRTVKYIFLAMDIWVTSLTALDPEDRPFLATLWLDVCFASCCDLIWNDPEDKSKVRIYRPTICWSCLRESWIAVHLFTISKQSDFRECPTISSFNTISDSW